MSNIVLWGTGIAPAEFALRRRCTSEGDLRVTDDGDVRVAYIAPAQVIFLRYTSQGDQRVTSEGDRRIVRDGLTGPQYFQTANVTTDGGEPFEFLYTTNPWQPDAQGGECVFAWVDVTISWSMSATVRITPFTDGEDEPVVLPNGGGTLENIRSTFVLEQQGDDLERVSRVFPVPLVRRLTRDGQEVSRWYLRGERLQLTVESTGPLGVGELMLDGAEVQYDSVRKAIYATVDSTP